jgi:hypothetical protein
VVAAEDHRKVGLDGRGVGSRVVDRRTTAEDRASGEVLDLRSRSIAGLVTTATVSLK